MWYNKSREGTVLTSKCLYSELKAHRLGMQAKRVTLSFLGLKKHFQAQVSAAFMKYLKCGHSHHNTYLGPCEH